jgi:hypothetical protein
MNHSVAGVFLNVFICSFASVCDVPVGLEAYDHITNITFSFITNIKTAMTHRFKYS